MRLVNVLAMASALALTACSGGEENAADNDAMAAATPAAPVNEAAKMAAKVTPQYLSGEWCYLRYEGGGETSEENITYVFAEDGTLKYQNNSSTPVDKDGSYSLDGGVVNIKPALTFFKFVPVAVEEASMILEASGVQSYWARGACAP